MPYEDIFVFGEGEVQVSGQRNWTENGNSTFAYYSHYIAFSSWEECNAVRFWLGNLDENLFARPVDTIFPSDPRTQNKYVLVFAYLGSDLSSWFFQLPQSGRFPCDGRMCMMRNLIKCQYHASTINVTLVWEMDAIHVNADSLPQISRLQPREQLVEDRVAGINRFLSLLVSIHGSAEYHYDKYGDFCEAVRRFFNAGNDTIGREFWQVYYHPFLWSSLEAKGFFSNIALKPDCERAIAQKPYITRHNWKRVVRQDKTSKKGNMYNDPLHINMVQHDEIEFFKYTNKVLNHLHQYYYDYPEDDEEDVLCETLLDFGRFWPGLAVEANRRLVDAMASIWDYVL